MSLISHQFWSFLTLSLALAPLFLYACFTHKFNEFRTRYNIFLCCSFVFIWFRSSSSSSPTTLLLFLMLLLLPILSSSSDHHSFMVHGNNKNTNRTLYFQLAFDLIAINLFCYFSGFEPFNK